MPKRTIIKEEKTDHDDFEEHQEMWTEFVVKVEEASPVANSSWDDFESKFHRNNSSPENEEFILPDKSYKTGLEDIADKACKMENETPESECCSTEVCNIKLEPSDVSNLAQIRRCSSPESVMQSSKKMKHELGLDGREKPNEFLNSMRSKMLSLCRQTVSEQSKKDGSQTVVRDEDIQTPTVIVFHSKETHVNCSTRCELKSNETSQIRKRTDSSYSQNKKDYEQTRVGNAKYSEPACIQMYTSKFDCTDHKRIHVRKKRFPCSYCEKQFTRRYKCRLHETTHTRKKPYSCAHCDQTFSYKLDCIKHEKTHTGDKRYWCSYCNKKFPQKADLIAHERVHTGEKPYSCTHCKKKFAQKSTCVIHERTHTGEKPYSCTHCNKKFVNKARCSRHEKSHTRNEAVTLVP